MFEEYERKKKRDISGMRSIKDYGMGIFFILVGVFFFFHEKMNLDIARFPSSMLDKFFGGMCLLYGAWRVYRGYKKNYFR